MKAIEEKTIVGGLCRNAFLHSQFQFSRFPNFLRRHGFASGADLIV
jgi:hypothetical protein